MFNLFRKKQKPDPQMTEFEKLCKEHYRQVSQYFIFYDFRAEFEDDSVDEVLDSTYHCWLIPKENVNILDGLRELADYQTYLSTNSKGLPYPEHIRDSLLIMNPGMINAMTSSEKENVFSYAREKNIPILEKLTKSIYVDDLSNDTYYLSMSNCPASADDAATYGDLRLKIVPYEEDKKQKEADTQSTVTKEINQRSIKELLSGTLVAKYKKYNAEEAKTEYVLRLQSIGFTAQQAISMFVFENLILKSKDMLAEDDYISQPAIAPEGPVLEHEDQWYVDHQMFTVSEIVKLWDEAEYLWKSYGGKIEDEERKKRIHALTRYGGGKLFLEYLKMVSEKTGINYELIKKYSMAEQDLLYKYRWKYPDIPYPYDFETNPAEPATCYITINSIGNDKVRVVKVIRTVTGASLSDAKEMAENLPCTLNQPVTKTAAEKYRKELESSGAKLLITEESE